MNTHIKHIMRSDYLQEMPIRKVFQKLSEGITHMVILKTGMVVPVHLDDHAEFCRPLSICYRLSLGWRDKICRKK